MRRMRFILSSLIAWLFFFYNFERLSPSIDLTGIAYLFVPIVAILIIIVPLGRRAPLLGVLLVSLVSFLALKILGSQEWASPLPLTIIEMGVIGVTVALARQVGSGLEEFEQVVAHITIGQSGRFSESFSSGQIEMYRELKRARHYERPVTMMAVGMSEGSIQVALDRMVQEAQRAMMKQYVLSTIASTLCDELEDYNLITRHNDHFLVLLPEVKGDDVEAFVEQLQRAMQEQLGVNLQIGLASFPDDAVTFDGLVATAINRMGKKKFVELMGQILHFQEQGGSPE